LAHKVCEILKTITIGWLAQSLKQPKKITLKIPRSKEPLKHNPLTTWKKFQHKFEKLSTPKTIDQIIACENNNHLLLLFMDAFVIEHILICLPMDPSMTWHLHQINKTWCKVVGDIMV
jgi:hypothetical protein